MKEILLNIDGKQVIAREGMTVLEAAKNAGIRIPTLCHHEALEPYGACRICMVELEMRGWTKMVASCIYPAEEGLVVKTRSQKIDRIRKMILELLLAHAPDAPELTKLAKEYGADRNRFEKEASYCIHCGLCVRYCAEAKKKDAIGFIDRGTRREINFIPEIASLECWNCTECFQLCPTEALQAAFVLTESLAFPLHAFELPQQQRNVIDITHILPDTKTTVPDDMVEKPAEPIFIEPVFIEIEEQILEAYACGTPVITLGESTLFKTEKKTDLKGLPFPTPIEGSKYFFTPML